MKDCKIATVRLCTARDFGTKWLSGWLKLMGEPFKMHRKCWEYAAITNVLDHYGFLSEGHSGLGFGVGNEPLACLFAGLGSRITATDLALEDERSALWTPTAQHAAHKEGLWREGLCNKEVFEDRVTFSPADMNAIPTDYHGQFDFVWSSSSLEHLGSIAAGQRFLQESIKCLKPGGVSIHTTEFNAASVLYPNTPTLDSGDVVVFRKSDIESLVKRMLVDGGLVEANWSIGEEPPDFDVDQAPYRPEPHLKLVLGGVVIMSMLLVFVKE